MRPKLIALLIFLVRLCACAPGNEKSSAPIYRDAATNTASNRDSTLSFQCIGLSNEEQQDDNRRSFSSHGRSSLGKLTTWQTVDIHKRLSEMERRISDLENQIDAAKEEKSKSS